jgi:putative endonuclease
MWTVYVLRSEKDQRLYVGMSKNLEQRLKEHNSKKVFSTKPYVPWKLIHQESFPDSKAARHREKFLKSSYGKGWLKLKYNSSEVDKDD